MVSAALTAVWQALAHIALAVHVAIVEPARPMAHAIVHLVIARGAAATFIERATDGVGRFDGARILGGGLVRVGDGICSSISDILRGQRRN